MNTGSLNLASNTGTYTVFFTSFKTNTGIVTGSGQNLLTTITAIQNTCVLGNSVIQNGGQINAYNSQNVAYDQTCVPIIRHCNSGILDGNSLYSYETCSPNAALNCTATTYNGYTVPSILHNANAPVTKAVT